MEEKGRKKEKFTADLQTRLQEIKRRCEKGTRGPDPATTEIK